MASDNEKVFGGLTAHEVIAGLRAEVAADESLRHAQILEESTPGSSEEKLALSGLLAAQARGDLRAHVSLVRARIEESQILRATIVEI